VLRSGCKIPNEHSSLKVLPSEISHRAVDIVIREAMLDFVVTDCQERTLHDNSTNLGIMMVEHTRRWRDGKDAHQTILP
jgi:hypothetical protein